MPYFLLQWTYKNPQIKALVERPHDRVAELRKVVETFGGTLHDFFFALGKFDGVSIVEFPDAESCDACLLTLDSAGTNEALKATVLITPEEGQRAMVRAGSALSGYRPPIGYASYG